VILKGFEMPQMIFQKPKRRVDRVFLHCSASDVPAHDSVAVIREWHLARGFSDIGYHFFIHKSGQIEAGRNIELTPAAQSGNNTATIAICLHGLKKENFTTAQFDALRSLALEIDKQYLSKISFHGHCEVSAKACPVFDYKKELKLDKYGSLGLTATVIGNVEDAAFSPIKYGDRGELVKKLQELLGLKADGIYGKMTLQKVVAYKKDHDLTPDGNVTKEMWDLLKKPILDNITTSDISKLPDLKQGSRGKSVELLQELLFIKVDGIFGPGTAGKVREVKQANGFYPSDLVQQHIWKLLFDLRRVEHYE
jgi:peptidoglycan hydrolase-like protein with peptidoglycan-binding domain